MTQSKIQLVTVGNVGFASRHLQAIYNDYFEFATYDPTHSYSPQAVFLFDAQFGDHGLLRRLAEQGSKTVVDNLWEAAWCEFGYAEPEVDPAGHRLSNPSWLWYHDSLWYRSLGYHDYRPNPDRDRVALMPMSSRKPHRDRLYRLLRNRLPDLLYSYVDLGVELPGSPGPDEYWTIYMNPEWYDRTHFSIVAESVVDLKHISEKSYKPMAYWHPAVIYGYPGILADLRLQGFETFGNIFDETYDTIPDPQARATAIVAEVNAYQETDYSPETQAKLLHNHEHFFDAELVAQRVRTEILEPLLDYVHTR